MTFGSAMGWESWDEDEDELEEWEEDWLDEAREDRECLDEGLLTLEQQLSMRRMALQAKTMTRSQLVNALLHAWEQRFMERRNFLEMAHGMGVAARLTDMSLQRPPRTKREFTEIFGYLPTTEQAMEYLEELHETATMELDMERIVDSVD